MFSGCNSLTCITVGNEFYWNDGDLPEDRLWRSAESGKHFNSDRLYNERSYIADTYMAVTEVPSASTLCLPAETKEIATQAFTGIAADFIEVPVTVIKIAADAFDEGAILVVTRNSYAYNWAKVHNYPVLCH